MSLTSFINKKEIRQRFVEVFPLPKINYDAELKAPPLTKNYSLVGTAFDYLLRFYIERNNSNAKTTEWVAKNALRKPMMKTSFERIKKEYEQKKKIGKTNNVERFFRYLYICYMKTEQMFYDAKERHKIYLENGTITDKLLESTLHLATLDQMFRSGRWIHVMVDYEPEKLEKIDLVEEDDIKDLRKLIELVNIDLFNSENICLLNPTFGDASLLVGGADADLIIDNRIIEIKTTKYFTLKREYLNQLIGYYILNLLSGDSKSNINNLSIYFSRYGRFFTIKLPFESVSKDKFDEFVKWFKKEAEKIR